MVLDALVAGRDRNVGSGEARSECNQGPSPARAQPLRVLSLFSGCGGLDLGFEGGFDVPAACVNPAIHPDWIEHDYENGWVRLRPTGFRTVFACDIRESARRIWVRNLTRRGHSPAEFKLASIVDLVKAHKAGKFTFPPADIVTGGFCCQDFSLAGKRDGFRSERDHLNRPMSAGTPTIESRGMLYWWMREVISIMRPRVFVAENVGAMQSLPDAVRVVREDFERAGYDVVAQILYAPDFGVPQTRERIIFVGLRRDAILADRCVLHPAPTHGEGHEEDRGRLMPYVTSRQALLGLLEPGESCDPSQRAYSRCRRLEKGQGQTEARPDKPGPTIRAEHHGNIEFRRLSAAHGGKYMDELATGLPERRMTVRECARLQTFPDDFELVIPGRGGVSMSDAYRAVGNAVPPLLAYHVATRLREIWPIVFGDTHRERTPIQRRRP